MDNTNPRHSLDGVSTQTTHHSTASSTHYRDGVHAQAAPHPYEDDRVYEAGDEVDSIDIDISSNTAAKAVTTGMQRRMALWKKVLIAAAAMLVAGVGVAAAVVWYAHNSIIVDSDGDGAASLREDVDPEMLDGEGDGRINGLLIGTDAEDGGRADTIMVVSFDPVGGDVTMISVPRDLYVDIDGFGSSRINAAHAYGEDNRYDGSGPSLLKQTVSETLDIPIHYYARVDFDGFKQGVDALGGIPVDVEEPLEDPHFPDDDRSGYEPLRVDAGEQIMDGETALRYVRSRQTTSDFDRSRRQQEVLLGARQQVLSRDTLSSPTRLTRLVRSLGDSLETNMSVDEITRLAELAEDVDRDDITQEQLKVDEDNGLLTFSNIQGQSVIVPSTGTFDQVQQHVRTLLVDGYIQDEDARVSVLNGTVRPSVAEETADLLRSYGYNVVNVDNAPEQDYEQSVVFTYNSDNPYTVRFLENRFGVSARHGQPGADDYDIEIVIGNDYTPDALTE